MADGRVWVGNSIVNPTAGQVLVTSGALAASGTGNVMKVKTVISSTAAAAFEFQMRDGAGTPVLTLRYGVAANAPSDLLDFEFDVPNGYSLNIVAPNAITGTIHAHILARILYGYTE